jgi:hypothetical protein
MSNEARSNVRLSTINEQSSSDSRNFLTHFYEGQRDYTTPSIIFTALGRTPWPQFFRGNIGGRTVMRYQRPEYQSSKEDFSVPGVKIITLHVPRGFETPTTILKSIPVSPKGYGLLCLEYPGSLKMGTL